MAASRCHIWHKTAFGGRSLGQLLWIPKLLAEKKPVANDSSLNKLQLASLAPHRGGAQLNLLARRTRRVRQQVDRWRGSGFIGCVGERVQVSRITEIVGIKLSEWW